MCVHVYMYSILSYNLKDTIESEPENVIKEDVIDEVVQDASVADGDDYNNDISIESAHIGKVMHTNLCFVFFM